MSVMDAEQDGISFRKVNKWFGRMHVLRDIDLGVAKGEKVVVCGPSGSGKSTMIRCINRLEEHQSGTILVDGIEVNDNKANIGQVRERVGMVFQNFNLYPHLSILDNCTLAQRWVRGSAGGVWGDDRREHPGCGVRACFVWPGAGAGVGAGQPLLPASTCGPNS